MDGIEVKNDLTKKFSKGTIVTHWLTALFILVLFPLGKYMEGLLPSEKMALIKIHAILGILVFILTLYRSYIFFKHSRPADLKTGSKLNDRLTVWIHNAFYFLLLIISVTGIATMVIGGYGNALTASDSNLIASKENIPPLKAHGLLAVIMMVLLVLHVIGVIKHYILTRENTLKRIS